MKMDVAIAKPLFNENKEFYIVLNDEYYMKISKSQYYRLRKYMKENHNDIKYFRNKR